MAESSVLIYSGKGSSHSWTWLADLFETRGLYDVRFVDDRELSERASHDPSLVIVSGGDGFEMASCLSKHCFGELREYLVRGGRYVGVCAGAYLPLPSRIEPFCRFNLSSTKIRNVIDGDGLGDEESLRIAVRYGSCCVYHPVRGMVELAGSGRKLLAPIYGGPIFSEPTQDQVLLRYASFTDSTQFQVDRRSAEKTMLGTPAAIMSSFGEGRMVLLGPHLEHPGFPDANDEFLRLCGLGAPRLLVTSRIQSSTRSRDLQRSIADFKVAVLGMEHETFVVGAKVWDGGRLLELLAAIESRTGSLDSDTERSVSALLDDARDELVSLGPERIPEADSAPGHLVEAARLCANRHFSARNG